MKTETHSLSADIAVAIAGVSREDYWGILAAIDAVLENYGISQRQRAKRHPACEHGISDGDWCQDCNAAYKAAAADPDNA